METEVPTQDASPQAWDRATWAPLALVFAAGIWNLLMWPIDQLPLHDWRDHLGEVAIGSIIVQQALCPLWGAWSSQPRRWRIPTGLAASFFLAIMAMVNSKLFVMALQFVLPSHLLLLVLLGLLRWKFSFVLTSDSANNSVTGDSTGFNLRYLFLWTAVVAILLSLGKLVTYEDAFFRFRPFDLTMRIITMLWMFIPPGWLFTHLLRRSRPSLLTIAAIVVVALAIVYSTAFVTYWARPYNFWQWYFWPAFSIMVGALPATAVAAMVLRWGGYRVYRVAKS